MLKTDLRKFNKFVGTCVSDIKVNCNVETEWFWLMGDCNPADLDMRTGAAPKDLTVGSDYQNGMGWMGRPEQEWPCQRTYGWAKEEMRKDMVAVACPASAKRKMCYQRR
jgi:hypothetical protein